MIWLASRKSWIDPKSKRTSSSIMAAAMSASSAFEWIAAMRSSMGLSGSALVFDRFFVRARGIVVADFLRYGVAASVRGRCSIENCAQPHAVLVLHFRIGIPRRLVGRNRIVLDPSPAGILEEIRTGISAAVHGSNVECRFVFR